MTYCFALLFQQALSALPDYREAAEFTVHSLVDEPDVCAAMRGITHDPGESYPCVGSHRGVLTLNGDGDA
jgi:hypothetical protein